jgi:alpha-methylacyl-CoA racemase
VRVLGLEPDPLFAVQHDVAAWPAMTARLREVFLQRTREEWAAAFEGAGACVTPVLSFAEAAAHPHNVARGTYTTTPQGTIHPTTAPRFSGTPSASPRPAPATGADTADVLRELEVEADGGRG